MSVANIQRAARLSTGTGTGTGGLDTSDLERSKEPELEDAMSFTPPGASPVPVVAPVPAEISSEALAYLHGFLREGHTVPKREDIAYMLQLKPLRELPGQWLDEHAGSKDLDRRGNPCDWNLDRLQAGIRPRRRANRKSSSYDGTGSDGMPRSPRSGSEGVNEVSKPTLPLPSLPAPQMFDDTMDDWEEAPGRLLVENTTKPLAGSFVCILVQKAPENKSASGLSEESGQHSRETRFIKDPDGDSTHDQTTVDIITVPCPGGDALRSWNRDGLLGRYFGAPAMRDAEGASGNLQGASWVRQGIRREANVARILLYEHPTLEEGTTIGDLADALLEDLRATRDESSDGQRPIVFLAHSLGGLVVKMLLAKASRDKRFEDILRDCYGVAFFGTPHQGSSYFSMPSLAPSIQNLLQLKQPLPLSITMDLSPGKSLLLRADEAFKDIAHDLRVWTLYETIDSRLSSSRARGDEDREKKDNLYFTAPLASIKSAIMGMRQERIFPLQSDHANVASFGRHNAHTLKLFLRQLAGLIGRADASVRDDQNSGAKWSLHLEQKVGVEVHGFFDDATIGHDPVIRAWSTKLPLQEFLRKGPEECLRERLSEVSDVPDERQFLRNRGRTMTMTEAENDRVRREAAAREGLGIRNQLLQSSTPPISPVLRPVDSSPGSAPEIIPTHQQHQQIRRMSSPPPPTAANYRVPTASRRSTSVRRPSPLIRADLEQEAIIDRLSPPLRSRSAGSMGRSLSDRSSPGGYRDFPPFLPASVSSVGNEADHAAADDNNDIDCSPQLPEAVVALRKGVNSGQIKPPETAVAEEAPICFARPDVSQRKFVWIHVPYNNPTWVKNIIETLQVSYKRNYSALYSNDFWASKHTKGRHSQHYAYFAKPGCYYTAPRNSSRRPSISPLPASPSMEDAISLCLFLPYLHFDSYKRLIHRRSLILQRLTRGRARPVPDSVAKLDSLEEQVVWEFLGHDPPINCRRTLDQFGYPSLRDTRGRDDDQMLYKLTKERENRYGEHQRDLYAQSLNSRSASYGSHRSWRERLAGLDDLQAEQEPEDNLIRNGNVLMVDQLWLWVMHSHTLLSFFPKRESDPIEGPLYQQADLRDSIFNEVNVDLTRQCENALDLAALSALHAVSVLLDRASHPDLEIFRIFEEAISVLTEKLTNSLKAFRLEGFRDKASAYEPVENKERSIRARHKEEGHRAERENRDNTSALLELRDLEDELLVLLQLFDRQYAVLSSMLTAYDSPALRDKTARGRGFIAEAIRRVGEYRHRADEMIVRVRATRDDYDKLLQMVQRQAQVDEVRLSRLHADLASAQSRSVMIFTVFTVIFLPLTFFTGLFGMNTREWEAETPTLGFIGYVSLPASFVLILVSFMTAFSTHTRKVIQAIQSWVYYWLRAAHDHTLGPVVEAYRQRQYEAQRKKNKGGRGKEDGRRGLKNEASDFWERHRLEREQGYQIPEVNRRVASGRKTGKKKDSRTR
ncbi:Protein SERAC1-like protein [Emericellopsis cladophorae]|uniref:Protein SERAC1-like protein n=1 Tax=Emericellopsis cladophorae TaxID=2686198 RepID=A0A9Q0BGE4_9HYPO|nr:Protein SERAC1-like protein [Emericellopsis cladophorae]KAI6784937.1 Protein SERAC1-like protein [Emericellopsis cladophorae]